MSRRIVQIRPTAWLNSFLVVVAIGFFDGCYERPYTRECREARRRGATVLLGEADLFVHVRFDIVGIRAGVCGGGFGRHG
jgi:hypothetical protein